MFAQREGGESREAEASSPGDGRCASGTVTLREIEEESVGEGRGVAGIEGIRGPNFSSLCPSSADYGRGRNWIGHVDTSCPKGGQYPAGKEEERLGARSDQRAQHGVCRIEAMSLQRRRRMISRSREGGDGSGQTTTTRACKLPSLSSPSRGRSAFQEERMEWEGGNNRRRR